MSRIQARLSCRSLWITLAVVALVGCAGDEADDVTEQLRLAGEERGAELAVQLDDSLAAQPDAARMMAQIAAAIAAAVNEGEVLEVSAAVPRLQNEKVRAFAERVARDHIIASSKLVAVLQQRNIEPRESQISVILRVEATTAYVELSTMPVAELDRKFIEKQIFGHAMARSLIGLLAIEVKDVKLRELLMEELRTIDAHLMDAIRLSKELYGDQQPD